MASSYIHIGKVAAIFGVKGELIVQHALAKRTNLKGVQAIFIEQVKDAWLPYFIENVKIKDAENVYVKLEGIDSKEAAHKLNHKPVWLLEEDFRKLAGTSAPIALLGYLLIDKTGEVGSVEEVIEQPHQVLLRVNYKGKDALIPLHEETLVSIDRKKKQLKVELPDGLLEIYADQ